MPIGIVNLYLNTTGEAVEPAKTEVFNGDDSCDDSCDSSTCDGGHCQSEE
jgi:hypothetical protein